jgi:hypothetical protein
VLRTLGRLGWAKTAPQVKRPLTEVHRQNRLEFCIENLKTDWNTVVFSDESMFQPDSNTIKLWGKNRVIKRALKRFPGLMVWGAISARGISPLAVIKGTIDAKKYQEVLEGHLLETMCLLYPDGFVFQQDNAPVHSAKSTKQWFLAKNLSVMKWPALSPDLNPIENVWGYLKNSIQYNDAITNAEFGAKLTEMWVNLDLDFITSLLESMPRRLEACIAANGDAIDY